LGRQEIDLKKPSIDSATISSSAFSLENYNMSFLKAAVIATASLTLASQSLPCFAANEPFHLSADVSRLVRGVGNWPGRLFVLTIKRDQFLGQPLLADISKDVIGDKFEENDYQYFLLSLQYNIPAIRKLPLLKYKFVRVENLFTLLTNAGNTYPSDGSYQELAGSGRDSYNASKKGRLQRELIFRSIERKRTLPRNDIRVLSIYPTNLLLDANFENTKEFEGKVTANYQGFSAGELRYLNRDTWKYEVKLARVAGISTQYSTASWTYYPVKQQPIILGNKEGYVIFSVPRLKKSGLGTAPFETRGIEIASQLNYELTVTPPGFATRMFDATCVPLSEAISLGELKRIRAADFHGKEIGEILKAAFAPPKPTEVKFKSAGPQAYLAGEEKMYKVNNCDVTPIAVPEGISIKSE
jgi:hypothetical protein